MESEGNCQLESFATEGSDAAGGEGVSVITSAVDSQLGQVGVTPYVIPLLILVTALAIMIIVAEMGAIEKMTHHKDQG